LLNGRTVWTVGRKWNWTDLKLCKGRFEFVVESREIPAHEPFLATLDAAMTDKSPIVRRVAAEFVIRELNSLGKNASFFARQLTLDRNPSIAERGHFALKLLNANV
jgi:hypothetical protein